jgi:hypothetical protein
MRLCARLTKTAYVFIRIPSTIWWIHGVPNSSEILKWNTAMDVTGLKKKCAKGFRINRTPFYLEIAQIEREIREKLNFTGRYKKTTAEMVLSIINGERKTD